MNRFSAPQCHSCPSRHLSLLQCCGPTAQDEISLHKSAQHYAIGQTIFLEGSNPAGLYCVHSGMIKISKIGGDGKEQIIRLAKGGDILGYRGLVTGTLHSASAIAIDDCIVCLIRKPDFFQQMNENKEFSNGLLQLLSKALGETEERMLHLAYKPVRERLAEALLLLLRTFRTEENPEALTFSILRDDLGALMGTTKETATRMLSEFKAEGMLSTHGSAITIRDPLKLVSIATQYD
ncbi:Crp/Fnr family transcriptional regulator [Hymenobacter sp. BT683]|uniref:Crp/Fnr family transcriptional regulator n=1 Tax=Hymenobacter jeongseonensis TaxID=2791027 RepID=A0ABS0IDY4_9BACT|nr:Crp/Fnr family transcriptional regulator [Hymenobacter jeongseonensis]MBF9236269.1 Crp/Fnr family transcriptional regulator [Hymenobacter jeongseonensis]